MDGEEHPHYTLTKAFESNFDEVKTIWWQQTFDFNRVVMNEVRDNKYDAVFLQIQGDNILLEECARVIAENSIGFNWTGDVRTNIDWYARLGRYLVTCFTNMTDVKKMRAMGLNAEYLQIGYDTKYYYPEPRDTHNNIVFCGNYYPDNDYPLTPLRMALVHRLKDEFGDIFNLYGGRWREHGMTSEYDFVNNEQEAEIYRTCAIAINCSHFDYSRYSSDRLLREMGCGAFVLSHNYKDIDKDFINGKHLVTWNDLDDLVQKCHYYLERPEERNIIGSNAYDYVSNNCTWDVRMKEFKQIINKYKLCKSQS